MTDIVKSISWYCDIPEDDDPTNKLKREFLNYRNQLSLLRGRKFQGVTLSELEEDQFTLLMKKLKSLATKLRKAGETDWLEFWAFDYK